MLYASTKATFKKEFGQNQIKEEVYANMREDVSLAGYLRHERAGAAPAPLSREEEEMLEIKQTEVGGSHNMHITQSHAGWCGYQRGLKASDSKLPRLPLREKTAQWFGQLLEERRRLPPDCHRWLFNNFVKKV